MNELQIALAIIGVAAILGILIYNRVQERKFKRQAEAGFSHPRRDALMEDKSASPSARRVEPALGDEDLPVISHEESHVMQEPRIDSSQGEARNLAKSIEEHEASVADAATEAESISVNPADAPAISRLRARSAPQVVPDPVTRPAPVISAPHDDLIEYRIHVKANGMLAGVFGDAITRSREFAKPVRWLGWPMGAQGWEELLPWSEKHYQEIMIGMQLADRNGAAVAEDLARLCNLVRETAMPHGLKVDCDDMEESLVRARSLDMFCVDVDVLIGLNVVARGDETLSMSRIRLEANNAGMTLATDGTFQLQDSRGEVLYALCNHESAPFSPDGLDALETRGVTLLFDVPRVADGIKSFNNMVALGRKLAHEAGGMLVDDNLRPLTDTGIEKIRVQLTQIYNKMESRGIPAGGRLALKLFS